MSDDSASLMSESQSSTPALAAASPLAADEAVMRGVIDALHAVAPDVASVQIAPDARLREVLELDSIDFVAFLTAVHERFGVDVPERDYRHVQTLQDCVAYLRRRMAERP
jgi:acyl carrier protein